MDQRMLGPIATMVECCGRERGRGPGHPPPVSVDLALRGHRWNRAADTVGLAGNVGWISAGRRRFLEAGGIGFITDDGRLNAAPEWAAELEYDARLAGLNAALD